LTCLTCPLFFFFARRHSLVLSFFVCMRAYSRRWRHLTWMETSMHADYPFKDELAPGYVLEKAPTITSSGN